MTYQDNLELLQVRICQLQDARMEEARERDRLRTNLSNARNQIERLRNSLQHLAYADWYATGHGTFEAKVSRGVLDAAKELVPNPRLPDISQVDPPLDHQPWFSRHEFALDALEIVCGILKDDNYTYGERCQMAQEAVLKSGLTQATYSVSSQEGNCK